MFANEVAVSQSASSIVRLMILQQLDLTIRSWRIFVIARKNSSDALVSRNVFFSHARSLLFILKSAWLRSDKVSFGEVSSALDSFDDVVFLDLVYVFLDKIELTRFDTKKKYDRMNVVRSNKHHGYT